MKYRRRVIVAGMLVAWGMLLWLGLANAQITAEQRLNASVVDNVRGGIATKKVSSVHFQTVVVERCALGLMCRPVTVVRVFLTFEPLQRNVLANVLRLQWLERLRLANEDINSDSIRRLQEMPNLRELHLINCNVDRGTPKSAGPRLALLDLTSSQMSPAALESLVSPGTIRELHAGECEFGSPVKAIDILVANLPELEILDVSYTGLLDEAVGRISGLRSLRELNLEHTGVTDVGLRKIAELKHLKILRVSDTSITDRGIRELARCKSLRELHVARCPGITQEALKWLREANPDLVVESRR